VRRPGPALLLALALAGAGCRSWGASTTPLEDPVRVEVGPGEFRHEPSGVVFPERIGRFRRVAVTRYDEDGLDASVGYDFKSPPFFIIATVYVFPAPRCASLGSSEEGIADMKAELAGGAWKGSVDQVLRAHEGSRLVADEEVEVVNAGRTFRGRKASFEYEGEFGGARLRAQSYLYAFCWVGEDWIVEYRFTYPAGIRGTRPLDELLAGIRWPRGPGQDRQP
jgi:hypothetical protein